MTALTLRRPLLARRLAGVAVPAAVLAIAAGAVLAGGPYVQYTAARLLPLGLVAASVALLTGIAGLPTIGQLAPYAVGGYTAALLGQAGSTIGVVQLAAAAAAAAAFSAVTGLLVIRTRGTVCLMLTLAIGELTAIAAGQWTTVTGGTDGLSGIPAVHPVWGMPAADTDTAVFAYVAAATTVLLLTLILAVRSPAGLLLTGVRGNEARMRASGHPVDRYLLTVFIAAGALAGAAGALSVAVQRYLAPADVGFDTAALVLLTVVVAGATSIPLAVVATIVVFVIRDDLTITGHGPVVLGMAFIAAVYLLPDGLAAVPRRIRARMSRRPKQVEQ